MNNKPRVIIRHKPEQTFEEKRFTFGYNQVRRDGLSQSLQDYRQSAWNAFERAGLPDQNSESWRRSNLRDFHPKIYTVLSEPCPSNMNTGLDQRIFPEVSGELDLCEEGINRYFKSHLAEVGVVFRPLREAEDDKDSEIDQMIGKVINPAENIFTASAGAFARYGSIVGIPKDLKVEKPFIINHKIEGNGKAFFSHHLIHLQSGSEATIVLEVTSLGGTERDCLHSGLVEIILDEGAHLTFIALQSLTEQSWNFGFTRAILAKDASMDWTVGTTGGKFSKDFSSLKLAGQGSHTRISGFYFGNGRQHIDHETEQDHLAPNTSSDLLFKGALKNESQAVWRGMIYVAPEANKTDGYQANRNLILSEKAKADSIPGLEILTDDVRCTHGATVGRIDQEQVFYLESRGVPRPEAEKLIVEGFFESVLDRIPLESIRERFREEIKKKMQS